MYVQLKNKTNNCSNVAESDDCTLKLINYRPCNCDANDGEMRADAGVFNSTAHLPVKELTFRNPGTVGAYGYLVLGKLYCSDTDFGW